MSKRFMETFMLWILFTEANCKFVFKVDEYRDMEYEVQKYVLTFGAISVVAIIRHFLKSFKIPIPYTLVSIILGIIVGTVMYYTLSKSKDIIDQTVRKILKNHIEKIYLPLVMFSTSFCIDVHSFLKSLPQILVISLPVTLSAGLFVGTAIKTLLDFTWPFVDGLIFGIVLCIIYPLETLYNYQLTNLPQLRQVIVTLEGETIVSTIVALHIWEACVLHIQGWTSYWYHFVVGILRFVVIGIPTGCLSGYMGAILMKMTYNECFTLMILTVAMCYSSYSLGEYMASSGTLCTVITGLIMSIERSTLPAQSEHFIRDMWLTLCLLINYLLYSAVGLIFPFIIINETMNLKDYLLVLVTYTMCNLGRFFSFLLFATVLRKTGYGLSFKNLLFCVWMGIKSPIILHLSINLDEVYTNHPLKARIYFEHNIVVFLLFLLINVGFLPIILRYLGITDISLMRQINMNNCMQHILQAREKKISILKMDRFLSDANWPLVITTTQLEHPYKSCTSGQSLDRVEDIYQIGMRFSTCPDCKKELPVEPTPKELRDMKREAKMRVLKLKKIFYSRQFENGMISKEGVRNLHYTVQTAMDSEEALIHLDGILKLFNKEGFFYRFIRNLFLRLTISKETELKLPRKRSRQICYKIISSSKFKFFIYAVILVNTIVVVFEMMHIHTITTDSHLSMYDALALLLAKLLILGVFFIEFVLKIVGYSWIYICRNGFKEYFTNFWDVLSFIVLLAAIADLGLNISINVIVKYADIAVVDITICAFRLLAVARFFLLLSLCELNYNKYIKYLETKIDKHRAMAYELGKTYLTGENEILENLVHIIDHDAIREELRQIFERDRVALTKVLGLAQKDRSLVVVFVKTKLVMKSVLCSMKEDIQELKVSGWVDEIEYAKLMMSLMEQYRHVETIKFVPHPTPSVIFKEIAWMGNDPKVIKFLYDNVANSRFEVGQVVCGDDEYIEGIFVLITGLLKVRYKPKRNVMNNLNEFGVLPIVDYISSTQYDETLSDYIVTGNCIGELSFLTQRAYDCTITAECHSQVYVLKREIIRQAMEMDLDPVKGLECRIWQTVSIRIAIPILMNVPAYSSYTQEQIKFTLERSFVPNVSNYRVFVVNDMMEDVLLIEGVVIDFNTKDVYTAPCYIPRSVQKLIMPKSSVFNMDVETEVRLLIIPAKNISEYDIMLEEEGMCELVSKSSTKCLQHFIVNHSSKGFSKTTKILKILAKRRSRQIHDARSRSRSRITILDSTAK